MRPVADAAARIAGKSFSKKYVALGRVVQSWAEIAGAEFARKARPVKIHYRKADRSGNPSVTLDIAISDSDATLAHYQKDLILERINRIFGNNWITDLKFVPLASETKARGRPKKPPAPLTKEQKSHLSQVLEPVSDPELKDHLEKIGQAILEGK
ncbi:MAG: DUF721 domain-containing protein [Alphaproteobacteria bacterium]